MRSRTVGLSTLLKVFIYFYSAHLTFCPVQHQCIPQAILGQDLLCQAKSGMGKTGVFLKFLSPQLLFPAVFVLAILQQLEETDEKFVHSLVICHTRELAFQISNEFSRFSKHLPHAKCAVFYGGVPISKDRDILSSRGDRFPNVVVGTPGRILAVCSFF